MPSTCQQSAGEFVRSIFWIVFQKDLSWANLQRDPSTVWRPYFAVDPLFSAFCFAGITAFGCWLASMITRNYSQVDRLWSILPCFYAWHFALREPLYLVLSGGEFLGSRGHVDFRLVLMAALTTVWSARLTYNFKRKGGYTVGSEDYRWKALRERIPAFAFQILNVTFVAFYQNMLLLSLTFPSYVCWRARGVYRHLNYADLIATGLFLGFVFLEAVADGQQWNFQVEKAWRTAAKEELRGDYRYGFLRHGLFRYSRHPNFFAEMATWWSFYFFTYAATGSWMNWSMIGPTLLVMLFWGSTWFTEQLSEAKYPFYAEYKISTGKFFPRPATRMRRLESYKDD